MKLVIILIVGIVLLTGCVDEGKLIEHKLCGDSFLEKTQLKGPISFSCVSDEIEGRVTCLCQYEQPFNLTSGSVVYQIDVGAK